MSSGCEYVHDDVCPADPKLFLNAYMVEAAFDPRCPLPMVEVYRSSFDLRRYLHGASGRTSADPIEANSWCGNRGLLCHG